MNQKETKILIRKKIRRIRDSIDNAEIISKSSEVEKKFFRLTGLEKVKILLIYIACNKEVQTRGIIESCLKKNMKIYLPSVDPLKGKIFFSRVSDIDNELEKGPFGIYQPKSKNLELLKDTNDIDLIVVPGMAFDEKGGRIGTGKGLYDKFLATVPFHISIIALAFEFQIVDHIIQLNHDISAHKVITEKRIISCAQRTNN